MTIRPTLLMITLSMSLYAANDTLRGSIISADGISIVKSSIHKDGEIRKHPYDKLLTPMIGYTQKRNEKGFVHVDGITGLEKFFDEEIKSTQISKGKDIRLNIPLTLQARVETITDAFKKELKADEVIAVIMESKSGKVFSLATSNRYDPSNTQDEDNVSIKTNVIEYSNEPGTIMMPIVFSMLLDKGLVNPNEMVNCHNGKYVFGKRTIVDEYKFKVLRAEDVIVQSSYIGITQLGQRLKGFELSQGLSRFGFSNFSGIDLPYEKRGSIPSTEKLNHYTYKTIISYGYGMRANTMQLLKAYNTFNNHGRMINPKVVNSLIDAKGKIKLITTSDPIQVISPSTAHRIKKTLIKTVNEGTATIAKTKGLEIGGKTGAVHITKDKRYLNSFNTSFIGFANDEKRAFTIAVMVREPRTQYSSSITAVPVFKAIVDIMVKEKYLKPRI